VVTSYKCSIHSAINPNPASSYRQVTIGQSIRVDVLFMLTMYTLGSVGCVLRDASARWTRRHNTQDHNLQCSENLKSHIISSIYGSEVVHNFNCTLKMNTDGSNWDSIFFLPIGSLSVKVHSLKKYLVVSTNRRIEHRRQ
jgi:hypothetical protein